MNEQNINAISDVSESPDKETDFSILSYENSIKTKNMKKTKQKNKKRIWKKYKYFTL